MISRRNQKLIGIGTGIILSAVLALSSCARKPEKELQDARNALKEVEDLEAPKYTPDEWNSLQSKLKDAETKIEEKKYKEAKEILLQIISEAQALKPKIGEAKKKAVEEAAKQQQAQEGATAPAGATQPQPPAQ
ncbi:hypothetical protein HRbin19_01419 [bacterium HR19]|nr:hypothetical protein HRbin19_01419 [bacterium HR19]